MLILPMPLGAFRPQSLIGTINAESKDLAQSRGWKMIREHEKMYCDHQLGTSADPVLGLRWSKSSEQHG